MNIIVIWRGIGMEKRGRMRAASSVGGKPALAAALAMALVLFASAPGRAGDGGTDDESRETKEEVGALAAEMAGLRDRPAEALEPTEAPGPGLQSYGGLGPAASKVYWADHGPSIAGYGEVAYANYLHDSKADLADAYRLVIYTGYRFTERVVMNAEIEFEHSSDSSVEFVNLDFLLSPLFNVRAGLVLVPMGIINEYHEPTVYNGVFRPEVERYIIPSTWSEIGVMAHGAAGGLRYKAAVLNGLDAGAFSSEEWIREGRYKGDRANASHAAFVLNLEYGLLEGLDAGASYYAGGAGEGSGGDELEADGLEAEVALWEVHADWRFKGFAFKALLAKGSLDGNALFESSPPGGAAKAVEGWYVEASYDLMPFLAPDASSASLEPFVRHEDYDTSDEVFSGEADPAMHRRVTTVGLGFKPVPNVVIKADYQLRDTSSGLPEGKGDGLDENKIDRLNVGVGFMF
jgi:hypothetical protein